MKRLSCRGCNSPLDASGYCTATAWCTFSDRQQAGALPGAREALDRARAAWERQNDQLVLIPLDFVPEHKG